MCLKVCLSFIFFVSPLTVPSFFSSSSSFFACRWCFGFLFQNVPADVLCVWALLTSRLLSDSSTLRNDPQARKMFCFVVSKLRLTLFYRVYKDKIDKSMVDKMDSLAYEITPLLQSVLELRLGVVECVESALKTVAVAHSRATSPQLILALFNSEPEPIMNALALPGIWKDFVPLIFSLEKADRPKIRQQFISFCSKQIREIHPLLVCFSSPFVNSYIILFICSFAFRFRSN
jgi:hypothetical protein